MIDTLIKAIVVTVLVCHTGIAWTLLLSPGNLLDKLAGPVMSIKITLIRDLLTCSKCISGQVAFWNAVWIMYWTDGWEWSGVAVMWVLFVIVVTDQLNRKYGYA